MVFRVIGSTADAWAAWLMGNATVWKCTLAFLMSWVLLHIFLCSFFGISIGLINPFLWKISNIRISWKRFRLRIRSVKLVLSVSSWSKVVIVLEGVDLVFKPVSLKENEEEDHIQDNEKPKKSQSFEDLANSDTPLCVLPESPVLKYLIKLYLLYFRFVGVKVFDLNLTWEDIDFTLNTDSILAKVTMQKDENNYKFNLKVRLVQESINDIELLDTLLFEVGGFVNMDTGMVSKVNLSCELREMKLRWMSLVKLLAKMKEKRHLSRPSKKPKIVKDEDYFVRQFQKRLIAIRYVISLVNSVNVSLHDFSLSQIPLANSKIVHCQKYKPLVFFELKVSSFVIDISRMHFESPGYGLSYDYRDKPYHMIYNFTGIALMLNNTKINTNKQVVSIPAMNFTGSSNYAFQTLEAVRNSQLSKSKIIFVGHVSEPILDFSTDDISTAAMSLLQYIKALEKLNLTNILPVDETEKKRKESDLHWEHLKKHQHLLPLFSIKFGIENPVVMMKSTLETEFYRILVLKLSLLSIELKSSRGDDADQFSYSVQHKVGIRSVKAQYINNYSSLMVNVFRAEEIAFKQRCDLIPKTKIESLLDFQDVKIDASNIHSLHGLNHMLNELQAKLIPLLEAFKTQSGDFECSSSSDLPNETGEVKPQQSVKDDEPITLVQIADELIPEWLTSIRVSLDQSTITLGSRSLLISKELMKRWDSQTKNDLVNGELRKCELYFEKFDLLAALETGGDDYDSSSAGSSLEDDDKGLFDSRPTETLHPGKWRISANLSKLIGKIISEKSSKKDVLKTKVFLKTFDTSVNVLLQEQQNKIFLNWNIEKVDLLYSVMTHFLIISCLHLLRNTILEFTLHEEHKSTKLALQSKELTRSQVLKKELMKMVELSFKIHFFDLILVLPDRLKVKLEMTHTKVTGMVDNPILINAYYMRLCVESPTSPGYWARLITAVDGSTTINLPTILAKGEGNWFEMTNDTCNLSFPNQFVIYKVFENITVMFKTFKQLHHSLKYNTNEFVINPSVKPASKLPKMNLKSRRLIFGMDDDPFESELNMIFQIGMHEQKMRYEKTKLLEQQIVEEFEATHKVKGRSTTGDTSKSPHSKILEDFSSFIPLSKKKGVFQKKHNKIVSSNDPQLSTSASEHLFYDNDSSQTPLRTNLNESSKQIHQKVEVLRESFSTSWIKRVKNYKDKMKLEFLSSFNFLRGKVDFSELPSDFNRKVIEYASSPTLINLILEGFDLDIGPPEFGIENVAHFIHEVGKGVPLDTEYSILIPVHLDLKLKELRSHLRDYPLPLIHMPAIGKGQPQDLPGVRLHGDVVIAEAGIQSKREVREVFVPLVPGCEQFDEDDCYSMEVPKTLTAIKSFIQLDWELNSHLNTKVTWGTSYQPCIQQVMLNLDNFTKPPIDPSEKVGFWDKLRMLFHARMKFRWKHDGHLHIHFKGSKDPYAICAESSGFSLAFQDDVVLSINEKDDPSEFLVVNSKHISFAVPNHLSEPLPVWSRATSSSVLLSDPSANFQRSAFGYYIGQKENVDPIKAQSMKSSSFEKSVITLSGGVQFKFAIAFERKLGVTDRTSSFKPHYEVYLSNPKYVKDRDKYDSYANFRSDFIHLGLTLISIKDEAYNKIQLSPNAFHYFFAWWRMFSNTTTVRHGVLFGPTRETAKFARHMYTIKYQAILEPLFIMVVYHDTESVHNKFENIDCYGLKAKAAGFVLDLHQRKELTFDHNSELGVTKRILKTKFNIGKVDMKDLDLRALNGKFQKDREIFASTEAIADEPKHYQFNGFDNDESWLDITDFIEIGQPLFSGYKGEISAFPLMHSPRFVYSKHNSYGDEYQLDFETSKRVRPFGKEEFHSCMISEGSLAETQISEFKIRLDELNTKLERNLDEISKAGANVTAAENHHIGQLKVDNEQIKHGIKFVTELLASYEKGTSKGIVDESAFEFNINDIDDGSTFINRFTVHNMLLKWNVTNRYIVFKFIYLFETTSILHRFLKHKALSQLDELIEDQRLSNLGSGLSRQLTRVTTYPTSHDKSNEADMEDLKSSKSGRIENFKQELRQVLVNFFYKTQDRYFVKLISPQIQLQSEDDETSCVLVVAPDIELNVIAFDANESDEEYNESIFEQRIGAILANASIFMFTQDEVINTGKLFFKPSSYGSNSAWPPWLGLELCYDGSLISDHMLMSKTSLVFRYDLAIASAFVPTEEHNINKISCDLSQAVITCDSKQYYTLYNIVTKLLIYAEPRQASHKQRESKLLFALDMNDLSSIRARIIQLQEAVKQADYLFSSLAARREILDDLQKDDMNIVASARHEAAEELHILMHVSLIGDTKQSENSNDFQEWFINADDIKLHLLDDKRDPFVDVILLNSHFKRIERSDHSDRNLISIQNLEVINLDKHSQLPIIFSSYQPNSKRQQKKLSHGEESSKLIQIGWNMDHSVGGIRVMKKFEVELLPVQISVEETTGDKILEFVFPGETPSDFDLSDNESTNSSKTEGSGKKSNGTTNGSLYRSSNGHGVSRTPSRRVLSTPVSSSSMNGSKAKRLSHRPSTTHFGSSQDGANKTRKTFLHMQSNGDTIDGTLAKDGYDLESYNNNDDDDDDDDDDDGNETEGSVDEMIQRASNYLSFVLFRLKSVPISITVRGNGARRLINVTDFVLNLPDIYFENKIYTLLDVTMYIKKAVIKALLSHTGSIISNKLFKYSDSKMKKKSLDGISNYASSRIEDYRK